MKKTLILCAVGLAGFVTPLAFAQPTTADAPATEANASSTVTAYVVNIKGAGWGVGKKARAALKSVTDISSFKLSGLRATLFVSDSQELSRETVSTAISGKGLKMIGFEKVELTQPAAAYMVAVKGAGGWTDTDDKVRVALEKMDNVAAAFVGRSTEIYLKEDKPLDSKAISKTLKKFKMKVLDSQKKEAASF